MAENREDNSREDLTEDASPYRLEEYRRKGMVSQSKEVSGLAALLAVGTAAYSYSPNLGMQLTELMREVFKTDQSSKLDLAAPYVLRHCFSKVMDIIVTVGFPICAAGFIFGALGSFLQIGTIFTLDPLQFDFDRMNPLQGIKKLISMKNLLDSVKLLFKVSIIIAIGLFLLKTEIFKIPIYFGADVFQLFNGYGQVVRTVSFSFLGILIFFAAADFGLQKFEYSKNVRMTKQEAKQEHREREGDPQTRARIKTIQRELARKRMMQAVKKADVIITNPTHIAIAIVYDKGTMNAPRVVAKGADFVAEKIKEIAAQAGVPRVENIPLARALFKSVKVGQSVPRALYQAVAEVLAYVYRLRRRTL